MKNLFFSVALGDVKVSKDVEGCTDVLTKEGPEALRKLLLENFAVNVDRLVDHKLI